MRGCSSASREGIFALDETDGKYRECGLTLNFESINQITFRVDIPHELAHGNLLQVCVRWNELALLDTWLLKAHISQSELYVGLVFRISYDVG